MASEIKLDEYHFHSPDIYKRITSNLDDMIYISESNLSVNPDRRNYFEAQR